MERSQIGGAHCGDHPLSTDDSYLQADMTPIAAKVAGYVRSMPVQDFERVRAGAVLAEIVDDDYQAAVTQLTASVASTIAQVQVLKAQRQIALFKALGGGWRRMPAVALSPAGASSPR
jgi:multidrug resistance efflux pump